MNVSLTDDLTGTVTTAAHSTGDGGVVNGRIVNGRFANDAPEVIIPLADLNIPPATGGIFHTARPAMRVVSRSVLGPPMHIAHRVRRIRLPKVGRLPLVWAGAIVLFLASTVLCVLALHGSLWACAGGCLVWGAALVYYASGLE